MACGSCGDKTAPSGSPTERTMFEVESPDGTTERFANFAPAQRHRNETDGAVLRPVTVTIDE